MVTRNIPLHKLVSVNFNVGWTIEDDVVHLIFYTDSNNQDNYTGVVGDKEFHVKPDQATVNRLKTIRDQIKTQLQNTILIEGTVIEVFELQNVVYPESVKVERVKVQ